MNRDRFDPILNTADPLHLVSAQKYAKKRLLKSLIKFKDFSYKAVFNLNKGGNKAEFVETITDDKTKNIIQDKKIGDVIIREQILKDFPPKEIRSIIDEGKKDIKSGIVVSIATYEDKVGLAVGISKDLTSKYDAVVLAKAASAILGGKGGGGRKDFAQAGGVDKSKIEEAFKEISKKIS